MKTLDNELHQISTLLIDPDIDNPRGEDEASIINDPEFNSLKLSIRQYGVLEPLIIKKTETNRYVLIDGERRFRASKELGLDTVPALVADSTSDGKILAYQIHMTRKTWGKIAEAKSIKGIVNELKIANPQITEGELLRRLMEITNAPKVKVEDLLRLALYDDSVIERVLNKDLNMSFLIENEKTFIPKLKRLYPNIIATFTENRIRTVLIEKAILNKLGGTRYLRREKNSKYLSIVDVIDNVDNKSKVSELLMSFFNDINMSVEEVISLYNSIDNVKEEVQLSIPLNGDANKDNNGVLIIPPISRNSGTVKQVGKNAPIPSKTLGVCSTSKNSIIPNLSREEYGQIKLTQQQQTSIADIKGKYEGIGKSFSKEEMEYVQEAITCIHNGCFKAATLMIWAASISRMLDYIKRDIGKFNSASKDMKVKKVSFYKHWCGNFQDTVVDIEEIREASKDMQVLCFICYTDIIDKTQFDKLKGYYQYRNNCAHPTSVVLNVNEVVALFEIIFEYVFNNPKLK